jgi:hypothetical protein
VFPLTSRHDLICHAGGASLRVLLPTSSRWGNSPTTRHVGSIADIRACIPSFERRPFTLSDAISPYLRDNPRLDTVVRLPHNEDPDSIPVGVVGKDYALVQHTAVFDQATKALDVAGINAAAVRAELRLTELGERMSLAFFLPDTYAFDPGDHFPMEMRLECLNSVDGSTRFRVETGWFRLVCSNGLGFRITRAEADRRHVGQLPIDHISRVLGQGLHEVQRERDNLERWMECELDLEEIGAWADGEVRRRWGFKAAARAFHIARSGRDVEIIGPYARQQPTTIEISEGEYVPGAPGESANLFDVAQVLAWLAKERRDLQEQIEWREQIPLLMAGLERGARA